ncbi:MULTISPECIES: hypothetical protein [Streptomyces]|uniref:hypothetical protein n=1 Tax=Streptomyces TaxID=1883 RepID=UPI00131C7678|nr:hypothetical protein [Streptomyces virginiae]
MTDIPSPGKLLILTIGGLSISALTACGYIASQSGGAGESIENLAATEVARAAYDATKSANSMTMEADLKTADGLLKMHMSVNRSGDCKGRVSMGDKGGMDIVKIGNFAYTKYDKSLLEDAAGASQGTEFILDRWIKTKVDGVESEDRLKVCNLDDFLAGLRAPGGESSKGGIVNVDGKKALILKGVERGEQYTAHIATEGSPYILRVALKKGNESGVVSFRDYNKDVAVQAPPVEKIVEGG